MSREPSVLDVAKSADREALYAALQAALVVVVALAGDAGRISQMEAFEAPVRRALALGDTLGSPLDLADRAAGNRTGHDQVAEALRQPRGPRI